MRPKPRARRHPRALRLRPGLVLRREPRLWWLLVGAAALTAAALTASVSADADRARAGWGTTRTIVVARHDLAAGQPLRHRDVELVRWPAAMVPAAALTRVPDGAVVATQVGAGEVLVRERLAAAGLQGVAALLPPGTRAVAIPTEVGTVPPLRPGDRVDVLVALAPEVAGDGPPGFVVAADSLVVAVDDHAVTVAVERDRAPRIAVALGQGAVTLALVGA